MYISSITATQAETNEQIVSKTFSLSTYTATDTNIVYEMSVFVNEVHMIHQ
jgi:hypothetical protein